MNKQARSSGKNKGHKALYSPIVVQFYTSHDIKRSQRKIKAIGKGE